MPWDDVLPPELPPELPADEYTGEDPFAVGPQTSGREAAGPPASQTAGSAVDAPTGQKELPLAGSEAGPDPVASWRFIIGECKNLENLKKVAEMLREQGERGTLQDFEIDALRVSYLTRKAGLEAVEHERGKQRSGRKAAK
jgi:hypothetical protein